MAISPLKRIKFSRIYDPPAVTDSRFYVGAVDRRPFYIRRATSQCERG